TLDRYRSYHTSDLGLKGRLSAGSRLLLDFVGRLWHRPWGWASFSTGSATRAPGLPTSLIRRRITMPSHRTHRDWTRRDVLAAGLAVAGAVGTGRTLRADDAAAQGDSSGPYSPFKMGIQSYSLRGYNENGRPSLGKALAVTKELGLHFWEAFPAHVPM